MTPLTTDTRTISSLVSAVDTDIMPTQGGSLAAGLERAANAARPDRPSSRRRLADHGLRGRGTRISTLAGELAGDGYRVSVLAVGTEQGAPIPRAEGGFVTRRRNGQVVVPQLDAASLQRLAAVGGGRYAALAPSDRDLDTLFPARLAVAARRRRSTRLSMMGAASNTKPTSGSIAASCSPSCCCRCSRCASAAAGSRCGCSSFSRRCRARTRSSGRISGSGPISAARRRSKRRKPSAPRSCSRTRSGAAPRSIAPGNSKRAPRRSRTSTRRGALQPRQRAREEPGSCRRRSRAYDRALELDPNHEDARYNRDLLKQYLEDNPGSSSNRRIKVRASKVSRAIRTQSQSQSGEQQEGGKAATSSRASRASKAKAARAKPPKVRRTQHRTTASSRPRRARARRQRRRAGGRRSDGRRRGARGSRAMGLGAGGRAVAAARAAGSRRLAAPQVPVSIPALGRRSER